MRELTIIIPPSELNKVERAVHDNRGTILAEADARRDGQQRIEVRCTIPNASIEGFFADVENVDGLYATFPPRGVLSLEPPADKPEDQVTDVQPLSPLEIYLSGLQSIGSWKSFLAYSALGGIVVWIALFTENMFLLVAAMLISPFAGPAMTAAMATARGDPVLLRRSVLRYVCALATSIATAFALSVLFQQEIATSMMAEASMRSAVSVLLPLAAGAAGAVNLAQSERSSLVSSAATGMLVAAALAPPAGLVGMGLAIGEMGIVTSSLWALAIQIVGINLAGFVVFRLYGVTTKGARYPHGKSPITYFALFLTVLAGAGLLYLQFSTPQQLQQSSLAQRVTAEAQEYVEGREDLALLFANAQFSRAKPAGQNPVLVTLHVQGDLGESEKQALAARIRNRIERELPVDALVDIIAVGKPTDVTGNVEPVP